MRLKLEWLRTRCKTLQRRDNDSWRNAVIRMLLMFLVLAWRINCARGERERERDTHTHRWMTSHLLIRSTWEVGWGFGKGNSQETVSRAATTTATTATTNSHPMPTRCPLDVHPTSAQRPYKRRMVANKGRNRSSATTLFFLFWRNAPHRNLSRVSQRIAVTARESSFHLHTVSPRIQYES